MTRSAALLVFALLFCVSAHACSCVSTDKPCGLARRHGEAFLGTPLRVLVEEAPAGDGSTYKVRTRIYTFVVKESFSSKILAGQQVEVKTGMGDGDCGYRFEIGKPYLVEAFGRDGVYSTSICDMTAPETLAQIPIAELRAVAHGGRLPDLTGLVLKYDAGMRFTPVPLEGINVRAVSTKGKSFETSTDGYGVYRFEKLPAATYTLQFATPDELIVSDLEQRPQRVVVPHAEAMGAVCHANFDLYSGGTLKVHVVDRDGKPVPGVVSAVPWGADNTSPVEWSVGSRVFGKGDYLLAPLIPESYRIEFHREDNYDPAYYFPGTTEEAKAKAVTVEEGKSAELRIVLP